MPPTFDHALQLFDSAASRAPAITAFIREGLERGESVITIATASNWKAVTRCARDRGLDLDAARAAGWLILKDANEFAAQVQHRNDVSWSRFEASIGRHVRRLAADGGVRVYGEAVDLLVQRNEFQLAEQLEALWNRFGQDVPLTLFCGYSSEHFGNPRDTGSLRRICALHSRCTAQPSDALASYLLRTHYGC